MGEKADQECIAESLPQLADYELAAETLRSLMLELFQTGPADAPILAVGGLRADVRISYMSLDVAHGGEGFVDGVEAVWHLHTAEAGVWLRVRICRRPSECGVAPTVTDPEAALREVIDTVCALINREIERSDRFTAAPRAIRV